MPFTTLVDLVFPPRCLVCQAASPDRGVPACEGCRGEMPRCRRPWCRHCGSPVETAFDRATASCAACTQRPPAFSMARSAWRYEGQVRPLIRAFKYQRRWRLGQWLAHSMALVAASEYPADAVDAVVPVPRHWLRRRLMGFHPAGALAEDLARRLHRPYAPNLLRPARWRRPQAGLSRAGRLANLRSAFRGSRKAAGLRVLLVDDVFTTGATAEACAAALREAGALEVLVVTAARTPAHHLPAAPRP